MASTIVLALVDTMGVKIWRKNFLVPREFCLWGDLSATATAQALCCDRPLDVGDEKG